MYYRKFLPPLHLHSYIECFYIWETDFLNKPIVVESPPSGFCSMVFNYQQSYQVISAKYQSQFISTPQSFITGQATKSYQLQLQGQIGMVGVVFKPSAIASIFELPMYEFVDERHDLRAVLGKEIETIEAKIQDCASHTKRIEVLSNYFSFRLLRAELKNTRIDYAANLIGEQNGLVNLSDLVDEMFVCRRQFERQFLLKIGVSPKYYARLRKISHLCKTIALKQWNIDDWQELIFQNGYYDQAHFIKEFKSFTGKSPSFYLKNNIELAHFLDS